MLRVAKSVAITLIATSFWVGPAYAQATRTWVSGVGDDANPCSRTAPCKTFAGAISKTAAGGEISCLDPAGFGAVTITKSLTISCQYTEGGVLAAGNGIVINALSSDVVYLRGLDIFGVNPPTNGVRILSAAAVHIEDCVIRRFNAANSFGVSYQPSAASELFISNTTIAENGSGATGGGVLIQPTGGAGSAKVVLSNVRIHDNANNGFRVDTTGNTSAAGVFVSIDRSDISGNTNGVSLNAPAGSSSGVVFVMNSTVALNSGIGLTANGTSGRMRVGNTTIVGNGIGVTTSSAPINTYGTNRLNENGTDGIFAAPIGQQ